MLILVGRHRQSGRPRRAASLRGELEALRGNAPMRRKFRLRSATAGENGVTLPFDVKRVYYLYDIPGGEGRGAHAHKELEQLIVAASGSFSETLDDGKCKRSFLQNRPYQGLYVKPGLGHDLVDFSSGAVAMVFASEVYQKKDYIRDYQEFLEFRKGK